MFEQPAGQHTLAAGRRESVFCAHERDGEVR
jgi:hypothetical protein